MALRVRSWVKGPVVVGSGESGNLYIDYKQTIFSSEGAFAAGELVYAHVHELRQKGVAISAVGGLTPGADPIAVAAAVTSWRYGDPFEAFTIRKEPKAAGISHWVEGAKRLRPDTAVLIIEDVVTNGDSTLTAIDRASALGLRPSAVLALVDRCEGGAERVKTRGLPFDAIFTRDDFVDEPSP
jgi:orotate phosphoribosyltransferase